MKGPASSRYRVTAVDRAVAVLDAFGAGNASLMQAEVARIAGLSEATTLRYLATLARHGLVERDGESGRYRLGLRLFQFGQRALAGRDHRQVALPHLKRLRERFDETVNLAMGQNDSLIVIEALESTRSIRKGAAVGDQDYWHASSLGKAILAYLPEEEVRGILERCGFQRFTRNTIRSFAALSRDLARVRELGYAIDNEEGEESLRCIGAPIFDRWGYPRFAISLSGPASRLTAEMIAEAGHEVQTAASAISARLGYTRVPSPAEND